MYGLKQVYTPNSKTIMAFVLGDAYRYDFKYLQHIGKIDRPLEGVIFLYICTFSILQILSIYRNLTLSLDKGGQKWK